MTKSLLITNIKGLVQVREKADSWISGSAQSELPMLEDAYLLIDDGAIMAYGSMNELVPSDNIEVIDASGRYVLPAFVDSHTHLVFAESREKEFVARIRGKTYTEIAKQGGGILNSAKRLQQMPEQVLFEKSKKRAYEILKLGTTCVEIKSGYGLTVEDELKMLRVARRLGREMPLTVKTTFLGAHAVPSDYSDKKDYIKLIVDEMIPRVAHEQLADYIDVFCEEGFFNQEETEKIILAGKKYGMKPKIHGNQLNRSGGVQAAVNTGAISVDHLEKMGEEEINILLNSKTMPTLLPGAAFFLDDNYPPARQMIDSGLPIALASDFNPGSAPSGDMSFILSLACIKMKMTPQEAINGATINAAYAMEVLDTHGSITVGKAGSILITKKIPDIAYLPYAFGSNLIETVIVEGEVQND